MMYHIVWSEDAFERMNRIVALRPDLHGRLKQALRDANRQLADNPESAGESQDDDFRIAFFDCLAIEYQVLFDDSVVDISRIGLSPGKR
jgi:plasmid stabilization system protein ParE